MPATHLATFAVDATVPLGHGLCGGWIKPATKIESPLWCRGVILLGAEAPVVLAAVDWTGICNDAHAQWTTAIARAAHTTPERVALHAMHQHNAPFVDITGQQLISRHPDLPACCDLHWFGKVQEDAARAIATALKTTQPVTHLAAGKAKVEKVASNRRIIGPDGKIAGWRASACKDPGLRDAPEGLIDPFLRTLTFLNRDTPLVTLHWYATHPMSYYGDGIVQPDFVGLARQRQMQTTGRPHIYFTGCAGNVAAGKYNDGAPARRQELADRLLQAMHAAHEQATKVLLKSWSWHALPIHLPPRGTPEELHRRLGDAKQPPATRSRAALQLSYLHACRQKIPMYLQALRLNDTHNVLHLPAECFVEYQLLAQKVAGDRFVACAAYGNGDPWYIPTAQAYPQGGYEPSASFAEPEAEGILQQAIQTLLVT